MNNSNDVPSHNLTSDSIASQVAPFVAELKAAGYATGTLCTKRAALRRFVGWLRHGRKAGRSRLIKRKTWFGFHRVRERRQDTARGTTRWYIDLGIIQSTRGCPRHG